MPIVKATVENWNLSVDFKIKTACVITMKNGINNPMSFINQPQIHQKGFTIVELLVVIVVIGILAALTVVSYTGISQRATAASLQADLSNASTQLELFRATYGKYPDTTDCSIANSDTNLCLKASPGNDFGNSYLRDNNTNPPTYSLTDTGGGTAYVITNNSSPVKVVANIPATSWKQISAGYSNTCAIANNDKVYCWGDNTNGQLGNGTNVSSLVPVPVDMSGVLSGKTIKYVSVGPTANIACAIASDDNAYCWGRDSGGQLGNNSLVDSWVPVAVDKTGVLSGKTVKSLSTGGGGACVVSSDNQVYCWGYNSQGQLGTNNNTTNSSVPIAPIDLNGVLGGKTINAVSYGSGHVIVIASDGNAYGWGNNTTGQLGNGLITPSYVPVAVVDMANVLIGKTLKSVSVGGNSSCVIASDDQVYCWGAGTNGILGNNLNTTSPYPVAVYTSGVLSGKTIKSFDAGSFHYCTVASDNNAYCWGQNTPNGPLGNNSTTNAIAPTGIDMTGLLSGKTIKSISGGSTHSCLIASDDQAYCFGNGANGRLGNNSTTQSLVPVKVNLP